MTVSVLHRFLSQVGTVDSAQQRKELFGSDSTAGDPSPADKQSPSDPLQETAAANLTGSCTSVKKTE